MMAIDFPPALQERVVCSIMAAVKYEVPANIVLAVAEKEGGRPKQWVKNSNGTYDVGSMQFNTKYLKDLKKYGITAEDVAQPGCYSFDLAAWRLRGHLRHDTQDLWTRAANYHSRTPKYNRIYRADLIEKATKWGDWLKVRFPTYSVIKPGVTPIRLVHTTQSAPQTNNLNKKEVALTNQQAVQVLDAFYLSRSIRGFA